MQILDIFSPRFGNINWHRRKHVDLVEHYSFVPLIKISPLIKMIGGGHSEIVPVNCVVELLIWEKPQAVILFRVFDVLRAV